MRTAAADAAPTTRVITFIPYRITEYIMTKKKSSGEGVVLALGAILVCLVVVFCVLFATYPLTSEPYEPADNLMSISNTHDYGLEGTDGTRLDVEVTTVDMTNNL